MKTKNYFRARHGFAVLVAVAALILAGVGAATYDLPVAWDASTSTNVAYRFYISTNGGPFRALFVTSNLTAVVTALPTGTNRMNVTAFDVLNGVESPPSNTLTSIVVLPPTPFNLRVNGPITVNVP